MLIAIVAFLAAVAGVLLARAVSVGQSESHNALHELLHEQLDLDAKQHGQIEGLEAAFAVRRHALELELRADNARLAEAIEAEHGYGPRVTAAVDRSHRDMGELQKETLAHIFAMRAVLRPDQAKKFDHAVVEALTAEAK
nr:periplasmic heavy metal sensor [Sphingomonas sp. ID1715]